MKQAETKGNKKITRKEAERIWDDFTKLKPALTKEEMELIERKTVKSGVTRRIALAVLTRSGKELIEGISNDREGAVSFAAFAACADEYEGDLKALKELVETANIRVRMALCERADVEDVLREGNVAATEGT